MARRGGRLERPVGTGRVVSVNVGRPRAVERNGTPATTAIWKQPVTGRVAARGVNLDGDEQADRTVHGGTDKAVYAYAAEDTAWWEAELGRRLGPGAFGENLTIAGVEPSTAVVG
jgi:MOSC domain-containing protein YiiM